MEIRLQASEGGESAVADEEDPRLRLLVERVPVAMETRLFEPFFTTKPEGTGTGLALCHTIVRAHGGRIEAFNNEDGPGASVRVVLPTGKKDQ
jgi:signal transduction histidine kinase